MSELSFRSDRAKSFHCSNCDNNNVVPSTSAMKGEWKHKLSKFHLFEFHTLICSRCGQMDLYDRYYTPK